MKLKKIFTVLAVTTACFCGAMVFTGCEDKSQQEKIDTITQEYQGKINELETKIDDLKNDNGALKDKIDDLNEKNTDLINRLDEQYYTITYDYNSKIFNDYIDLGRYFWYGGIKSDIVKSGTRIALPQPFEGTGMGKFKGWYVKNSIFSPNVSISNGDIVKGNLSLIAIWDEEPTVAIFKKDILSIPDGLYYGNNVIKEAIIPESVRYIGNYAFAECTNLEKVSIQNQYDQYGKVELGTGAFLNCENLTELECKESNVNVGDYALANCVNYTADASDVSNFNKIGNNSFERCEKITGEIRLRYKSIGERAFALCDGISSVVLKEEVTIGDYAFSQCEGLLSITLPYNFDINSSKKIFSNCPRVVELATSLDELTEEDRNGLGLTHQPLSITSIYENKKGTFTTSNGVIYYTNSNVSPAIEKTAVSLAGNYPQNIIIDDDCVAINYYAFLYGDFESVTIPSSVTSIGDSAFSCCTNLKAVILPNSVTSIGEYAFSQSALTAITIPNSVTTIGGDAFNECANLELVIIESETISNSITNNYSNGDIIGNSVTASVYIKSGLATDASTYLLANYTKQETSDKEGYDLWLKNESSAS